MYCQVYLKRLTPTVAIQRQSARMSKITNDR